jgi:hypothetical protein
MRRRDFVRGVAYGTAGTIPSLNILASCKTRSRTSANEYDVIVCGAGPSGISAAINASRLGARTLLIERYGRVGGMGVQALVGPLMGNAESKFMEEVLSHIGGRKANKEILDIKYCQMLKESYVDILLHTWITDTITSGNTLEGIKTISKDGEKELYASIIVDATGDGDIAHFTGARYEKGRKEDGLLQPMSIMFILGGVEKDAMTCGGERPALKLVVGDKIWHDMVVASSNKGELPENVSVVRLYQYENENERIINASQINSVDGTKAEDLTRAETEGREQAIQIAGWIKKNAPGYQNSYIARMPAIIGVRETRRILGEYYLTKKDLVSDVRKKDAVVRSASFVIDIHNPDGGGQAHGLAEQVKPYDIPYGCLVPETVDNLIMAGRCISGSHEAHASYRVQCICMAIGAASGTAAALAVNDKIVPRKVDVEKVQHHLY